jgi:hypothetical protein
LDKLISFLFIFKDAIVSVGRWIETHSDFVSAAATIAIAAFTLTLWWATRRLWKVSQEQSRDMKTSLDIALKTANAAQKSAEVAEIALHVAERAYLSISNFELRHFKIDDNVEIIYQIKNVGRTPAKIIKSLTIVDIFDKPIPIIPNYINNNIIQGPKRTFLQPGEAGSMYGVTKYSITQEHFNRIHNENSFIFVWGNIIYSDVFNNYFIKGFGAKLTMSTGFAMMDGYNYIEEYKQNGNEPNE